MFQQFFNFSGKKSTLHSFKTKCLSSHQHLNKKVRFFPYPESKSIFHVIISQFLHLKCKLSLKLPEHIHCRLHKENEPKITLNAIIGCMQGDVNSIYLACFEVQADNFGSHRRELLIQFLYNENIRQLQIDSKLDLRLSRTNPFFTPYTLEVNIM